MLDRPLREAPLRDRLHPPLLQRHHAHHEHLQELGLLLGIRRIRRLQQLPPALHRATHVAGLRRARRIHREFSYTFE